MRGLKQIETLNQSGQTALIGLDESGRLLHGEFVPVTRGRKIRWTQIEEEMPQQSDYSVPNMRRSRQTQEARMALESWEEYGSDEMLAALKLLSDFQKAHPDDYCKILVERRNSDPSVIDVDKARRRVKTHYLKALWLYRNNLISETLFSCMLDTRGIALLYNIVRPMTNATDPNNPEMPDFEYLHEYRHNLRWKY